MSAALYAPLVPAVLAITFADIAIRYWLDKVIKKEA